MKAVHTGVWLYSPRSFDPYSIAKLKGLEAEATWLIHKVICLTARYKHGGTRKHVKVSRQTMQQFIQPKRITTVVEALLAAGVLECDFVAVRGVRPFGYRLGLEYMGCGVQRVEVTKRSLAAKIVRHRLRRLANPVTEDDLEAVQRHLLHWLRQVRIRSADATSTVNAAEPRPKKGKTTKKQTQQSLVAYWRAINLMTISQIEEGEFDFTVCRYGRIHTPITRLLTDVRRHLFFEGCDEPLVGIDIRNSQLTFFTIVLLEHLAADLAELPDRVHPEAVPAVLPKSILQGEERSEGEGGSGKGAVEMGQAARAAMRWLNGKYTSRGGLQARERERVSEGESEGGQDHTARSGERESARWAADVEQFRSLVMDGRIYDVLMDTMQQTSGSPQDRKSFKQEFFASVLYGDSNKAWVRDRPLAKLFAARFPTVWGFICQQKLGNFKSLARSMQRRESSYMFGGVCKRLMDHHADIPVVTIHDSVVVPARHVETVRRIMLSEFERIGIRPTLHDDKSEVMGTRRKAG